MTWPGRADGRRMSKRLYIETYGCQMNLYDSRAIRDNLRQAGWLEVDAPDQADVVLMNTCAIRDGAETRVLGRIGEFQSLKYDRPEVKIGVLGCMAEEHERYLQARMPHVDLVVGPSAFGDIDAQVDEARRRNLAKAAENARAPDPGAGLLPSRPDPAQLRVQDLGRLGPKTERVRDRHQPAARSGQSRAARNSVASIPSLEVTAELRSATQWWRGCSTRIPSCAPRARVRPAGSARRRQP